MKLTILHPGVIIIYYLILIIFAFSFNDPYYLATFLFCVSFLIILQGMDKEYKGLIKFFIPMCLFIIILNPLVSHVGIHKIFLFGNYFITLEAVVYGIIMSLSLLILLLLFASYNSSVSHQEMLYIFSDKFPNTSMVTIMSLRFIPLLNYRLGEVNKIFGFSHENTINMGKIDRIKNAGHMLSVVVAWSLEESMITAKSMKARGYGTAKRTNYLAFTLKKVDYILILLLASSVLICVAGLLQGNGRINIYPELQFSGPEHIFNIYYLSFLILLLPLIYLEIKEKLLWS